MAKYSGSNLFVSFGATTLTGSHRTLRVSESYETVDATREGDTFHRRATTVSDGSASLTIFRDTGDTTRPVNPGTEASLVWGPRGNGVGMPRYTVNALCTGYDESYPFDGAVEINIAFTYNGTVVEDTF